MEIMKARRASYIVLGICMFLLFISFNNCDNSGRKIEFTSDDLSRFSNPINDSEADTGISKEIHKKRKVASSSGIQSENSENKNVKKRPDIIVILADDVGVDRVGVYKEHPRPGKTPHIDSLANKGILFRNAWAAPVCSPSRAMLLTGRYPHKTGVGAVVGSGRNEPGLKDTEVLIPEALGSDYDRIALGKWHVSKTEQPNFSNKHGFDYSAVNIDNIKYHDLLDKLKINVLGNYFSWEKVINGEPQVSTNYNTQDIGDEAVNWIQTKSKESNRKPLFMYVAFNAGHAPYHEPPTEMHSQKNITQFNEQSKEGHVIRQKAMIEAMDKKIGEIIKAAPEAIIIFAGDNGTPPDVTTSPFLPGHAKTTIYEGGINVPLIIAGPNIQKGESQALVSFIDILPTVTELTEKSTPKEVDGISLVPYLKDPSMQSIRKEIYTERFTSDSTIRYPKFELAVRNDRYKLIRFHYEKYDEFYDLSSDPFEVHNLVGDSKGNSNKTKKMTVLQKNNYESLKSKMDEFEKESFSHFTLSY